MLWGVGARLPDEWSRVASRVPTTGFPPKVKGTATGCNMPSPRHSGNRDEAVRPPLDHSPRCAYRLFGSYEWEHGSSRFGTHAMSDAITRLNAALQGRYAIERKVALKVLKPELAAVVGAERFLAEIKTTANLTHPHILPLHDSGEADGFLFYVMPHVDRRGITQGAHRPQFLVPNEVDLARRLQR